MADEKHISSDSYQKIWELLLEISEQAHLYEDVKDLVSFIHSQISKFIYAKNFYIALYEEEIQRYYIPYFVDEVDDDITTTGVDFHFDKFQEIQTYDLSNTITDYVRRYGKSMNLSKEMLEEDFYKNEITLYGTFSPSWLGVPLKIKNVVIGVLAVQHYEIYDMYSAEDEKLLIFISDHIAQAIERRRSDIAMKKQHDLVKWQNKEINDSIRYARRIQSAVLPSNELLDKILPEHFVLFKPKDVVSGDFYWIKQINHLSVIAIADCTGHGVPGAFMSMLGISFLNEIIGRGRIRKAGDILDHLRSRIKETLKQEGTIHDQKDGMDIALAIINNETGEMQFAGAFNPIYIIRQTESDSELKEFLSMEREGYSLYEVKGDRQPISVYINETRFTTNYISLKNDDCLYMFSDGYPDQIGGHAEKKYMVKSFKELLLNVRNEDMHSQKLILDSAIEEWKQGIIQVDDILVFGIKWNRNSKQ